MRKNLSLLFLLLPLAVFSAECVKLSSDLYRIENEFIKADITASGGARCLSLVDKRTGLEYTSPASDMGIGGECDWQEKKMKNSIWFGKPYAVLGTQKGAKAEIRFQRSGTGVVGQWMTITKTYALDDKSTEIEVLYDIAVRAGMHCAPRMHAALGTTDRGAVRFSFGVFNTEAESDAAVQAVKEIAEDL